MISDLNVEHYIIMMMLVAVYVEVLDVHVILWKQKKKWDKCKSERGGLR